MSEAFRGTIYYLSVIFNMSSTLNNYNQYCRIWNSVKLDHFHVYVTKSTSSMVTEFNYIVEKLTPWPFRAAS